MCYGIGMSLLFSISGFTTSFYLKLNNASFHFYFPIAYFSLMELFQAIQYLSVANSLHSLNTVFTIASYIHICFQPIFFNMFQYGYSNNNANIYYRIVYPLCFLGGLGMLMKMRDISTVYDNLYEYFLDYHSITGCNCNNYVDFFESNKTLAFIDSADNHIGWEVNLHKPTYCTYGMNLHFFLTFILPTVVERTVTMPTVLYFIGATGSFFLSKNLHVVPAIWCLIHIPIMILGVVRNISKTKVE